MGNPMHPAFPPADSGRPSKPEATLPGTLLPSPLSRTAACTFPPASSPIREPHWIKKRLSSARSTRSAGRPSESYAYLEITAPNVSLPPWARNRSISSLPKRTSPVGRTCVSPDGPSSAHPLPRGRSWTITISAPFAPGCLPICGIWMKLCGAWVSSPKPNTTRWPRRSMKWPPFTPTPTLPATPTSWSWKS